MKTQLKEVQAYPFAWFDELIEKTLSPAHLELNAITPRELNKISGQLQDEAISVVYQLNNHTFGLSSKTDIQAVAEQYYWAILDLQRQAIENLKQYAHHSGLLQTGKTIVAVLEDLIQRIRRRYHSLLPKELPAHFTEHQLQTSLFKLWIKMSGDQIGIIAKASFQAGLLPAKSLRAALRSLAPYLATDRKDELSADSLRSNACRPETGDLDTVLATLQRLTDIVRGYYRRR